MQPNDPKPYDEEQSDRIAAVLEGSALAPDDEYVWIRDDIGRAQAMVFRRYEATVDELKGQLADRDRKLAIATSALEKIRAHFDLPPHHDDVADSCIEDVRDIADDALTAITPKHDA